MFHRSLTANIVELTGPAEEAGEAGRPPRLIRPIRRCGWPGSSPEKPRASTEAIARRSLGRDRHSFWIAADIPSTDLNDETFKSRRRLPASRSRDFPRVLWGSPPHSASP